MNEAERVIRELLAEGFEARVNDSEGDLSKWATDPSELMGAVCSVEECTVQFRGAATGMHKGTVYVVDDGRGPEVNDYSTGLGQYINGLLGVE